MSITRPPDTIELEGSELVDFYLDDKNWVGEDNGCNQYLDLNQRVRLNLNELLTDGFKDALRKDLRITEYTTTEMLGPVEVIMFEADHHYYLFTVWHGRAASYEAVRWDNEGWE